MFEKLREKWNQVDKPEKEKKFEPMVIWQVIVFFLTSYGLGWLLLYGLVKWESVLPRQGGRYTMIAWSQSYFIYMFMMVVPLMIANKIYNLGKKHNPANGFASIIGFLLSGLTYMFIDVWFGGYMAFAVSLAFFGNLMSQGDYTLKPGHLIYYFLLGIYAVAINTIYMYDSLEVWVFLQFIHLHLFTTLIASVKIRQWSYMYMIGWAFGAIVIIVVGAVAIADKTIMLLGIYSLAVPPLLALTILTYFFKIQRKVKANHIGMDK
ncbi:MAG: hypothetical protein ACTSWX_04830 [Promethearchaeota archaeon]